MLKILRQPRTHLVALLLLTSVAFLIAAQNWYTVRYLVGQTNSSLLATGSGAWSQVQGITWFWAGMEIALLISRGFTRTLLAWLNVAVSGFATWQLAALVREGIPPMVQTQLEKLTGISTTGSTGAMSDAVVNVSQSPLSQVFLVLSVVITLLGALTAWFAPQFASPSRPDKYERKGSKAGADIDGPETNSLGDTIGLWDSQR